MEDILWVCGVEIYKFKDLFSFQTYMQFLGLPWKGDISVT
jgi:hypothetical protein